MIFKINNIICSVVLVLFVNGILSGQTTQMDKYEKYVNLADQYKKKENYQEAIKKYKQAFSFVNFYPSATPLFNLSACAIRLNRNKLAEKYIMLGISKTDVKKKYLDNFKEFESFRESKKWDRIQKNYVELRNEYYTTIPNIDVYIEIEKLIARDQLVRALFKENKNNSFKKIKDSLMIDVDDKNIRRLLEITKEHGWQRNALFLLWHHRGTYKEDNFVWNYFIPTINEEIEQGKMSRSFWAAFEDHKSLIETGIGKYGVLPGPVDNKVNERRASIFLPLFTKEEIEEMNSSNTPVIQY